MITLIVARALDGAIGRDGTIPWEIPEDLKAFQRETLGGALIMGRKTWESLPVRPLQRRLNIVVSSQPCSADHVVRSVSAALELAHAQGFQRVYGIGGAGIYAEMLPLAHRLLISDVEIRINDADTFFPQVDLNAWDKIAEMMLRPSGPACCQRAYLRRAALRI